MAATDPLQQQISELQQRQATLAAANKAGRDFKAHLADVQHSIGGLEETIGRRGSDAAINQAEADRERAYASQVSAKNPKLAQEHLNKATAAQSKADAARSAVQRATQARDEARATLNSIVPASETTAEARAFRRSPGDVNPATAAPTTAAAPGAPAAPPAPPQPSPAGVPTDLRQFQAYLNTRGAGLVVDGIIGPKTAAAAAKLGVPLPSTQRAATAAAQPAPLTTVAAPTTPAPNLGSIDDQIRRNFGFMSWAIDDPEIGPILRRAVAEGWDSAMLEGAVTNTTFWKTHTAAQTDWLRLQKTDPATVAARTQAMTAAVSTNAKKLGITIAPDRMATIVDQALSNGWAPTDVQVQQAVGNEFHYQPGAQQGTIGAAEQQIRQMASGYLIKISDPTLADWDARVARGEATPDTFREYMITQAKGLFPSLSKQLDAGLTVDQLAEPFRQTAASELGVSPDSIDFNDPKWMRALSSTDPKTGQPSMMGLADWTKTLRSDPTYRWDETVNGKTAYTQAALALAQALGVRP